MVLVNFETLDGGQILRKQVEHFHIETKAVQAKGNWNQQQKQERPEAKWLHRAAVWPPLKTPASSAGLRSRANCSCVIPAQHSHPMPLAQYRLHPTGPSPGGPSPN